ncbi:MAG: mechanosensitive ion channel domain-containing protein [Rikenellaceae bacterium]
MSTVTETTVTELTDSLANEAVKLTDPIVLDSLPQLSAYHIFDLLQRGVDEKMEVAINTLVKSALSFSFNLALSLLVLFIGRWTIKRLSRIIELAIIKKRIERSVRSFLSGLINILLYSLLLIIIVQIMGINTTSLVAMLASIGLAIGMALSGTLQNFAGGVMILVLKPYKVGDYITTQEESGTVVDIMLFNTVLETRNRHTIFVPNGSVLSSSIKNATFAENRRVDWNVGISYGDSVAVARRVIMEILEADERILHNSNDKVEMNLSEELHVLDPMVGLEELGDSSVNLVVRAWVETANYWDVYYEIYEKIYEALPKRGITFPFPQVDLHIKNGDTERCTIGVEMVEKITKNR